MPERKQANYGSYFVQIKSPTPRTAANGGRYAATSAAPTIGGRAGQTTLADSLFDVALSIGNVQEVYAFGRDLLGEKKLDEAKKVFQANAARFEKTWHAQLGLTRYFMAVNDSGNALASIEKGLQYAQTERQKKILNDLKARVKN